MEPVNAIAAVSGCSTRANPESKSSTREINPAGAPTLRAAATIISPTIRETRGCPGLTLMTTAHPAASAAAVSPPATPNANGKLLAPNTPTTPSDVVFKRRSGRGGVSDASA